MENSFWKQVFLIFFLRLLSHAARPLTVSLLLSQALWSAPLAAAEAFLLPWHIIGWDAEFSVRHREPLQALSKELESAWMTNPQDTDSWLSTQQKQLSSNQKLRAKTMRVGPSRDPFAKPVSIVPILCPLADKAVFAVQIVDVESQRLLAGAQVMVPQKAWAAPLRKTPNAAKIDEILLTLKNKRDTLANDANRIQTETLPHAFKLQIVTEAARHADEECLSLLASHELLSAHPQIASQGNLYSSFIREQLFGDKQALRATRTLKLNWGHGPFKGPNYLYTATWNESVFAGGLSKALKGQAELKQDEQRLQIPEELRSILTKTQAALQLSDLPQVVRIDRAWAYLDRGRAYGLEMDDRLYFKDGDRVIKAHVVGFYGPALRLKNPEGQEVQEGAIVYVRKGQKLLRVGDRFGFDPTRFPTAWPPVTQPAGG